MGSSAVVGFYRDSVLRPFLTRVVAKSYPAHDAAGNAHIPSRLIQGLPALSPGPGVCQFARVRIVHERISFLDLPGENHQERIDIFLPIPKNFPVGGHAFVAAGSGYLSKAGSANTGFGG